MAIKVEFRRRLERLYKQIGKALDYDSLNYGLCSALYSVFTYMWFKSPDELQKK